MFALSFKFNQDISVWDISNVTDISYMWDYTDKFNQNLSSWNTSNITNMEGVFGMQMV